MRNAIGVTKLNSDGTYKLIWQNYPVLQLGTTDLYKKYHPFGIAVCTRELTKDYTFIFNSLKNAVKKIHGEGINPQYLISDAAHQIHNGFNSVFDGGDVIMCWFHMQKNTITRMEAHIHDKKERSEFLIDLHSLQVAPSIPTFDIAVRLFKEKWQPRQQELIKYMEDEWLNKNRNWFEGFAKRTPSTNNALESFNRVVKDEQTLRERMDISQFRVKLFEMVKQWGFEYKSGLNKIHNDSPNIDLKLWTDGYNWAKSNVKFHCVAEANKIIHRPLLWGKQIDMKTMF